ncbi:hypothetical protein H7U32_03740 [Bifidobacterium pullorum subsp. saeculare]|uniref:Carbon starvation protein n=1 Tax=Bifidobacterium pullorum subsp. saeculare TaxID=78257 RepID=A0A938WX38_9BIFI|nr:hypothetical protein [Bifidobacterium pullorum]MBM6699446.1 hypothetical protein [Bifidobacterium pullorum subsp. saeculare]
MSDKARMILYALTAAACAAWEAQSVRDYIADGTLTSAPSIIFLVCVGVATVYCAINAFILWQRNRRSRHDGTDANDVSGAPADKTSEDGSAA